MSTTLNTTTAARYALLITLRQAPDGSWRASTPSPFPESAHNPEGAREALHGLAEAIFPEQR